MIKRNHAQLNMNIILFINVNKRVKMTLNGSHEIGKFIRENGHAPWWPCFLTDQICISNFGKRSFSDHFYQIILNSEHRFHRGRF